MATETLTFRPDSYPENTSVDGWVRHYGGAVSWATLIASAGWEADDGSYTGALIGMWPHGDTDKWRALYRGIFLFDTSSLPDDAEIISATFSIYGALPKEDYLGIAPDINIYSSNPAANNDLVAGDFDSLGSTPFCDTPITYANWDTAGFNDFALNAAGIAAISRTGITKLGTRNANYDVAGVAPSWSAVPYSWLYGFFADMHIVPKQPKLVVTFTSEGVIVYPTEAVTRVTSITHRYDRGVYNIVVGLGDVISDADIPSVDTTVRRSYTPKEAIEAMMFPEVGMYKCPICGMILPSLTLLFLHLTVAHGIGCTEGDYKVEGGVAYRCEGGQWVRGM